MQKVTFPRSSHIKIKGIDHKRKDKKGRTFRGHLDKEAEVEDEMVSSSGNEKQKDQVSINTDKNIEIKEPELNVGNYSKEGKERAASIDILI